MNESALSPQKTQHHSPQQSRQPSRFPQQFKRLPRPPLVRGLPLLGSAVPLLKNPHEFVKQAYADYGEVFRFKAAHREYVVLAGQDANRFVSGEGKDLFCSTEFWGKAADYMKCPHMLIAVDGEMHTYQRNALMSLLGQKAFKDRLDSLAEPIQSLIDKNAKRGVIPVGPVVRQMISNQIGYNLQGYKTSYEKVEQMIYYFGGVMKVFGMRNWPRLMLESPRFKWAEYVTRKQIRKTLELARQRTEAEKADNPLFLDTVIPLLEARPDWFSEGDLGIYALLPFIGALDTAGATIGFMLHRLLQNPELMARIRAEVDSVFAQGLPDIKTLRSMEDLNGLIRETMRLQPTGFGITRNATRDFEYKGYQIRKGQDILVFTTSDHTNPRYFPEPEKFDIDRHKPPRNEYRQPAYAPFGKGPHMCLGASLAEIILPLNMGLILYHLDIESACDLRKVKMIFNPAPVLSNNFKVRLSLRHPVTSSL